MEKIQPGEELSWPALGHTHPSSQRLGRGLMVSQESCLGMLGFNYRGIRFL